MASDAARIKHAIQQDSHYPPSMASIERVLEHAIKLGIVKRPGRACEHKPWRYDSPHCAEMSCPNYVMKHQAKYTFVEGRTYRIRTLIPPQRREREHVMRYNGMSHDGKVHFFDARPFAGTQRIEPDWITSSEQVPDETECYAGRPVFTSDST